MHIAGDIDEHVGRAEFLDGRGGESLDRRRRQHIERRAFGGLQAGELVGRDIGRNHARAFRRETLGDGAADALPRGGDNATLPSSDHRLSLRLRTPRSGDPESSTFRMAGFGFACCARAPE